MTFNQLTQLKLNADATVYFIEAKAFIEKSLWDILLRASVKKPPFPQDAIDRPYKFSLAWAVENNVEKFPAHFLEKKETVRRLLKEFHRLMQKTMTVAKQLLKLNFRQAYEVFHCKCNCWEGSRNRNAEVES